MHAHNQEKAVTLCRTTLELYEEVQRQWNNVWEQTESEEPDSSAYHSMIHACFNLGFEVSTCGHFGASLAVTALHMHPHFTHEPGAWGVWHGPLQQLTLSHFVL